MARTKLQKVFAQYELVSSQALSVFTVDCIKDAQAKGYHTCDIEAPFYDFNLCGKHEAGTNYYPSDVLHWWEWKNVDADGNPLDIYPRTMEELELVKGIRVKGWATCKSADDEVVFEKTYMFEDIRKMIREFEEKLNRRYSA